VIAIATGRRTLLRSVGAIAFASISLAALVGCAAEQSPAASPSTSPPVAPTTHVSLEQRMIDAIDAGDVEAARAVLDAGLSPDAPIGGTAADPQLPLHRAAGADQTEIVTTLLDAGATVDATSGGLSPLMLAASSAGADTVQALLDGGADPTLPNYKFYSATAWHYAGREGNIPALQVFLGAGVDINLMDTTKTTALIYAAFFGQAEAVEFLLANGADPNIRDQWNSTARGWADFNGFPEIAGMIKDAGGVL
jgi:ankyrin repeat protein